ncbi:MAG: tetratricopeptide repeat protein [Bacteroidota bacterium]
MLSSALLSFLLIFQIPSNSDSLQKELNIAQGESRVAVLNKLCQYYLNNNPNKADSLVKEALTLAKNIGDSSGIASSYNNIGLLYKNKGNLDEALVNYLTSAGIQERNNLKLKLANTLGNIGTIYSIEGQFSVALDYFRRAQNIFVDEGDDEQLVGAFNNIGNVYLDQKQLDSALFYYQRAMTIYEELKDNSKSFLPFESIGNIYFQKGDLESAIVYYQSAYDLYVINKDTNGMSSALHNIGMVYKLRKEFVLALESFNSALEFAQTTANLRLLSIIYQALAETYFESGDTFMAYSYQKLHDSAKDSLFSEASTRLIAKMEAAYEMEKMESELQSLQLKSEVQQLRIKNDKIIIFAIIIISIVGISLTTVIIKELRLIKKNKKLVEEQRDIIEEKNKSITYSIDYSRSIQKSLLNYNVSAAKRGKFFVLFEPKDIVSGDFYWYKEIKDLDILAVADCTGHGVAGAFMTVVGHAALEQIVNKDGFDEPAEILHRLTKYVQKSLKNSQGEIMDHSMDIGICRIDRKSKTLTFAGINHSLVYVESGELREVKGNKIVQGEQTPSPSDFLSEVVQISENHTFYMYTDGFQDQFGGSENKKYMLGRFKKLLSEISTLPFDDQKHKLKAEINEWRGENEQTDDIAIVGFRP